MKLYKIGSIKKAFKNSGLNESIIRKFFLRENIFGNLSIRNFYTRDNERDAYIDEDDAMKLCLLLKLKHTVEFDLSKVGFKPDIEFNKHTINGSEEFKLKMIEHYKNPVLVEKKRKEKELEDSLKIHNQEFSKNFDNYEVDINSKKIISIDFEFDPIKLSYSKFNMKSCSECGITIYENNTTKHYHFYIEDGSHKVGIAKHLVNKFEFGETQKIDSLQLIQVLKDMFKDADFLLAHGMETEYTILEKNGIDISINNTQTLDTTKMFQKLDTEKVLNSYRLKDIIRTCDMNDTNVHNAGNDAAYTLKTFLEMNKRPEEIKLKIKELAIIYDKTKTKRPTFKM